MQNILITGVSTGMGFHCTKYFIEKGFRVFGSVRKEAEAEQLKKEFGKNFIALIFDVRDQKSIDKVVSEVENISEGRLDLLVNNAGVAVYGPLKHLPVEDLHYQMDVNLYGVLRVTQAFLPLLGAQLPARVKPGKIVNIGSVSGFVAAPFLGAYAMSKFALEALSDSLRRELSIYNIDVITLEPGAIKTQIWNKTYGIDPKYLKTDYGAILKNWDRMVQGSEKNALPAQVIAEKIHKVLTNKKPKTRYIIAKKKLVMLLVKYILPHRFIDKQLTKSFKKSISGIER